MLLSCLIPLVNGFVISNNIINNNLQYYNTHINTNTISMMENGWKKLQGVSIDIIVDKYFSDDRDFIKNINTNINTKGLIYNIYGVPAALAIYENRLDDKIDINQFVFNKGLLLMFDMDDDMRDTLTNSFNNIDIKTNDDFINP
tara:strand:+ start:176 stop:607 length:432 start_codon:yes stop_codon:yes gene_type:complete